MSVAGKVKEFIETCPFLKDFEDATFPLVNMNLLEENPTMYSIEETPADPIVKRFTNGDTVRQYVFSLCSRELYGQVENEKTAEFLKPCRSFYFSAASHAICAAISPHL